MSFPRYPNYKDSGVEWLGEVPEHWEVNRARNLGVFSGSGIDKKTVEGEQPVKMFNYLDVYNSIDKTLPYSPDLMDTTAPAEKAIEHAVRRGDILLTPSSETSDDVGHAARVLDVPEGVVYSYHILRFRGTDATDPAFLTYSFNAAPTRSYFTSVCTGTTRMVLGREDFKSAPVAKPPPTEQTQIAAFLDRETAKIDELVAEQRRLMELLKEKRQAVISHAVTQGLNPHAPMKPSGIEWLGDVPAHWNIGGLTRFIGPVVDYRGRTPTKVDDGVFLVTARNIRGGRIDYDASEEFVDPESAASLLARGRPEIGDLLFTMEAPLGQVALIDRVDIALAQRVVKFRGHPNVMRNDYLLYWFMSSACQARLETLATGSTALGIKASKLGMIECLVPPTDEQLSIVSHIEREAAILDTLTAEAQRAIDLLQERRTALISAAVTGQIDVRQLSQTQKVGAGETATQEASKLVNLPHENHT